MHNAKFDLEVAHEHLGLPLVPTAGFHDTMFEAFLVDPHAQSLSLKPMAERWLDLPPEEQEELRDWIMANVPECRGKSKTWRGWGAYISRAPGRLVGRYAKGDVIRTRKLHDLFYPRILEDDMEEAYQRELNLMPLLLRQEKQGVPLATNRLRRDVHKWERSVEEVDNWLRRRLKARELDVDSANELADALERSGKVTSWVLTDKGNRSLSKENLPLAIEDPQIVEVLAYRGLLTVCLRTFGRPWLEQALHTGGWMHTSWNQVRQADERSNNGSKGTRTGRLSSNPNFQNIPTPKETKLPKALREKLSPIPSMRDYIVPDSKDRRIYVRDYSQQEFRILGHFEDGALMHAYKEDPFMDVHEKAQYLINKRLGTSFSRKPVKNTGFGLIYGMGAGKGADAAGTDVETFRRLKNEYLGQFPGLRVLVKNLNKMGRSGEPIRTWGGRLYYCEPPMKIRGRLQTFEYKLLNYLIQGSAADCTKEALLRYDSLSRDGRVLLTVHDEIVITGPADGGEMELLRQAMESIEFDVPMLSDGKWSRTSWARLKSWRDSRN